MLGPWRSRGGSAERQRVDGGTHRREPRVAGADEKIHVHIGASCEVGEIPDAEGLSETHDHVQARGLELAEFDSLHPRR
ncbi:hypothetical protein GCM10022244_53160 [Streptomyces gulbargensis]|uniref:Uncharacterized protein n=1 Tax=Streptomyces gulbargensis TaxID=364901 RepID=A0ABP7N685_9ACTN